MDTLDIETLIRLAEQKAKNRDDGHLTIMRFTSHWKVMGGTPNLDVGGERGVVYDLPAHKTLEGALFYFILNY